MKIKVLGTGCSKCAKLFNDVKKVVEENQIDATVEKIDDVMQLMNYNIMASPAIVIDEEVKVKGRVPSNKEILELLNA